MTFCIQRSSEKSRWRIYKGIFVFILETGHMTEQVYDHHHSDSKWSNWIFYGMLAMYRHVEAAIDM